MSPIVVAEQSAIQTVVGSQSAHQEEKIEEPEGLGKTRYACAPGGHVKQEERKNAIGHIEKLLEQITQLQNEIENYLKTERCLEQENYDLGVANEQSSHQNPQRKKVQEGQKQQADELSVMKKSVRKRGERSHKNTKKDNSHQADNNKVRKKLCLRCKKRKGNSDFHKDKSCKDGLARWCKECKAQAARKYRKGHKVKNHHQSHRQLHLLLRHE